MPDAAAKLHDDAEMAHPKLAKADDATNYRDAGKDVEASCGACRFYGWGSCALVEGAIEAAYVCDLFRPPLATMPASMKMGESAPDVAPADLMTARPLLFSFDQEWIAFLPKPGNYHHSVYGGLDLPAERLARIVANFQANVYGQDLPINCEHDGKAAGAVGWIKSGGMRLAADGSIEVRPEWNERGKALIDGERFRYVSAEFCYQWQDPVSGVWYDDVAVGLAICTRPHFKTDVLRPLAASEAAALALAGVVSMAGNAGIGQANPAAEGQTMTEQEKAAVAAVTEPPVTETTEQAEITRLTTHILAQLGEQTRISDPVVQQFAERAARELAEAQATAKRETDRATSLADQNAILLVQNRVKTFTDEVMGHGDKSGIAYVGHIPDHVRMLCSLADKYGPGSWELNQYKAVNRAHAEEIKAGTLFQEIGSGRGGDRTMTAYDQLMALATERARTSNKTVEQEFDAVLMSEHEMRAAYARERRSV